MSESAPRRGRPRSTAAELAVLEATYRLLAGQGLAATSIDAIARESRVSKMTIYKWWPRREALLVDAFLRQAGLLLPFPAEGEPLAVLCSHAAAYATALGGEFGRVQLAVIAECIASTGSAAEFAERYLRIRRALGIGIIHAGQQGKGIRADTPAAELYDRIYGTLFYQSSFGLSPVTPADARRLVVSVLGDASAVPGRSAG